MKNMTLENLAKVCGGTYVGPKEAMNIEVSNICIDSRKITEGGLFVATKGQRVDGHSFIPQVMEKGALAVISEKELTQEDFPTGEPTYILVKESFQALKDMAAFYRNQLSIPFVGITGSVGKTSTKEMIAGVLSAKFQVLKTQGNFNNEVGVPLTLFEIRDEHEVAVVEMGISDFGEMSRLTAMAQPNICVITNIGQCHLENLKDRDGILRAKTEIFEGMRDGGTAVLNGKDDKLITVQNVKGGKPKFFGSDHCYAEKIESLGIFGSECEIHTDKDVYQARIHVPGMHQIDNAMAAVLVAEQLGLTKAEIEKGIESVEAIGGRNHIIKGENIDLIDDCYNANPVSMQAAIDLLALANSRKVAILGDMFELGVNSVNLHKQVGSYAAMSQTDIVICIGDLSRDMYEAAMEVKQAGNAKDGSEIYYFETKDAFLAKKNEIIKKGDTLLLKASHGMSFETMIDELTK